jgi:aspartate/methionine/tyrosine aminotransferase
MLIDKRPHDLFTPAGDWSWRTSIIHLFSFSKSYCLPGHRLGAIVAGTDVITQIKKFLDNIQVTDPVARTSMKLTIDDYVGMPASSSSKSLGTTNGFPPPIHC